MKRTLMTALVSTSLLVAPGCKDKGAEEGKAEAGAAKGDDGAKDGDEGKAEDSAEAAPVAPKDSASAGSSDPLDALGMLPEGSFLAVSMDVGGLQKVPMLSLAMIEAQIKDPEDKATYSALKECGLTINLLSRITVGGEDGDGGLAIIDGKGISEKGKAECFAAWALKERGEKTTFEDGDGFTRIKGDKDGLGYLVGGDRLIFTEQKYAEKVEAMIAGKGAKAVDGSLKGALAIADTSASVMGVVGVTDKQRGQMGRDAGPLAEMTGAAFAANQQGDGIVFNLRFAMPDAAKAGAAKTFMEQKYAEVKPMAAMFGIPPNIAAALTFGTNETSATATLSLSAADLEALKKIAEAQSAAMGGGGAGMGGPPPGMGGMPGGPPVGAKPLGM